MIYQFKSRVKIFYELITIVLRIFVNGKVRKTRRANVYGFTFYKNFKMMLMCLRLCLFQLWSKGMLNHVRIEKAVGGAVHGKLVHRRGVDAGQTGVQ